MGALIPNANNRIITEGDKYQMYEDLFRRALNIEDPWTLTKVDFDPDEKRIDTYLYFAPGTKFECPVCNNPECPAYDTKEKV